MAKRNVKDPEERKQELINIASRLFERDGYEKVSVRDILAEVNGAPGMFYYYFKSKEDIFLACMETYFEEKLKNKLDILQNKEIDYEERIKILRELIVKDIGQFTTKYNFSNKMVSEAGATNHALSAISCSSCPQDLLRHFRGLLHVGFSLSDAVAALHFANVVKVSDKPKLFRKKSCLAPLFSFAALVADVSISVDALAVLFGCHIGRNVAVVYGCDNELMEAKVHKVG